MTVIQQLDHPFYDTGYTMILMVGEMRLQTCSGGIWLTTSFKSEKRRNCSSRIQIHHCSNKDGILISSVRCIFLRMTSNELFGNGFIDILNSEILIEKEGK